MSVRTIDELVLEFNPEFDPSAGMIGNGLVAITPAVGDPDLPAFRVRLTERQSLVGFPKFGTIGVGFEEEEDWNTNLPYTANPERLADHISHNRLVVDGDGEPVHPAEEIPRATVLAAIRMIREAAAALPNYGKICSLCNSARYAKWREGPTTEPAPEHSDDHWSDECTIHQPTGFDADQYAEPGQRDEDGWPIKNYDDDEE